MRERGENTPNLIVTLGGFIATASVVTPAGSVKLYVMVGIGAFLFFFGILLNRVSTRHRTKELQDRISSLETDLEGSRQDVAVVEEQRATQEQRFVDYRESLLSYELHNLIQIVGTAVATEDRAKRCTQARVARQSIVFAAAKLVGDNGENGTRANLFRFDRPQARIKLNDVPSTTSVMHLEPSASAGRGAPSTRSFPAVHPTTRRTLACYTRFVTADTTGSLISEENESIFSRADGHTDVEGLQLSDKEHVPYAAFTTYPVAINPNIVYGVLTVDHITPGVLSAKVDVPILSVLADLIAITYECEIYPNVRNGDRKHVSLHSGSPTQEAT